MPSPAVCLRCQTRFDAPPASGVCPACGSRLAPETAQPASTPASVRPTGPDAPTLTAPGTAERPTLSAPGALPPPAGPPPDLPGYRDLTPVGVGGMGAVYRAVQRGTDRVVAVKFVHPAWAADRGLLKRFETEARALARVKHAGVVQVFEVGAAGGPPYFSMEYVPGGTLTQLARAAPLPPRKAAEVMAAVAGAVAAAHAEGLLHRDLKPGNVLLAADGTPRVTDFGLAKFTTAADGPTLTGAVLGTPSYMAPEQAAGRTADVDERTDVYGLGATFYELLTGRPPFKGDDNAATMVMVLTDEPVPPRSLRPAVSEELEAVCLKCLEKDRAKRYQTAQAVADELDRWLAGKPTEVRPPSRWAKARRWAGRHRVKLAVALLAVLTAAAGVAVWESDPRRRAERALEQGEPVVLVGESGLPKWHRWALGEVTLATADSGDKTCSFSTHSLSVLELCRDPIHERYRLTAEFRHLRSGGDRAAGVGVYVGWAEARADEVAVNRFIGFELDDVQMPPPGKEDTAGLRANDHLIVHRRTFVDCADGELGFFALRPAGLGNDNPWRQLTLDVSPDGIAASWRTAKGNTVAVLTVPVEHIKQAETDDTIKRLRRAGVAAPPAPAWNPRSPLGVYIRNASGSFKNVVLTPLTPSGVAR